jgi:putative nucleotidyltransferase with HDIG domain
MTEDTVSTEQPLTVQIKRVIESRGISLPPMPEIISRLQKILSDEARASSKKIADVIRTEPAAVTTLLRMANSAAFGGLQKISDLSQAIARLGFKQVTSAVTTLVHRGHFESQDPLRAEMIQTLWGHAVATALGARHLAELTGAEPEESYVAGLLHDTGKLLVLKAVDHLQKAGKASQITPALLCELMGALHTELGQETLRSWNLPEPICNVALRHHDEGLKLSESLIIRVQAADAISRKIGEHLEPNPELDLLELHAVEQMNLSDVELASLLVDLEDEIAEVKGLL